MKQPPSEAPPLLLLDSEVFPIAASVLDGFATWNSDWLQAASHRSMVAFRMVESQVDRATMQLADTAQELDLLEDLLETSKPPLPDQAAGLHYLLATPFRYASPTPTRFRRSNEPGLWYGADSDRTACAELSYWRMRLVLDSAGLAQNSAPVITTHTCIQARVSGPCFDLSRPPFDAMRSTWMHTSDYTATQALAESARHTGAAWIHYESVRENGGRCAAVLDPVALAHQTPTQSNDWNCMTWRDKVIWRNRSLDISYTFEG